MTDEEYDFCFMREKHPDIMSGDVWLIGTEENCASVIMLIEDNEHKLVPIYFTTNVLSSPSRIEIVSSHNFNEWVEERCIYICNFREVFAQIDKDIREKYAEET